MELSLIKAIFGWMLVVNVGIYTLAAVFLIFARDWVSRFEARLTGVPAEDWPRIFVDYLSMYKIAILVFNLAPYVALVIVG